MSKIKKVLAVFLTLAMVLGMGLTTFAAGTSSTIKVGNAEGAKIKYVQIVAPDTASTIGWKFTNDTYADAFKTAYGVTTADAALEALIAEAKGETSPNANAASGTTNSSAKLGAALTALSASATNDGAEEFTVNSAGLYLITASKENFSYIPMLAYVNDNGSGNLADANVTAKGSTIIIDKSVEEDGQSVSKGDKVNYTANLQYPYFSADATDKSFTIVDTLTNATFEEDYNLAITIGGTQLPAENYTADINPDNTLTINFINYNSNYANMKLEISYTATVGDVSAEGALQNKIQTTIGGTPTQAIVISDTVKFQVTKTDDKENVLSGAEFTLYVKAEKDTVGAVELKVGNDTFYGVVVDKKTTTDKGLGVFDGLDAQKVYYVKETVAPDGYSLNDTVYELKGADLVSSNSVQAKDEHGVLTTTTTHVYNDFDPQSVVDTKLSSLPSTGGIGTTIFTIGGCLIMIIAAALFFASRRKNNK
jgi:LPXTG-motif cell wall-anchored protein